MANDKNTDTTPAAPTFEAVPVADLPAATKAVTPETIALGKSILAIIGNGTDSARESTVHKDKKAATARAAVLKRAVNNARNGVSDGKVASTRIVAVDGGFKVAVLLADKPAATPAEGETPAEGDTLPGEAEPTSAE